MEGQLDAGLSAVRTVAAYQFSLFGTTEDIIPTSLPCERPEERFGEHTQNSDSGLSKWMVSVERLSFGARTSPNPLRRNIERLGTDPRTFRASEFIAVSEFVDCPESAREQSSLWKHREFKLPREFRGSCRNSGVLLRASMPGSKSGI